MVAVASQQLTHKLIDALYIEALVLADEARTYFDEGSKLDKERLAPEARVHFSCEAIKVTTRLMHVITWLLSARATTGGGVRAIAFVPPTSSSIIAGLPESSAMLIAASEELYNRVTRLDARLCEPVASSPVRQLIAQLDAAF